MIPVYRSLGEIPAGFGPSVASIGNFDGVHLGHREILSAVVREARGLGAARVAVTFDPHPERFLRPARALRLLTPMDERIKLLAAAGVDAVVVLPFDDGLAGLTAEAVCQRNSGGRSRFAACTRAATSTSGTRRRRG
jgi:riboflavin kinase/FMN adenylyltransferase